MIRNSGIGVCINNYISSLIKSKKFEVTLVGKREEVNYFFENSGEWNYVRGNFPIYSIQEQIQLPIIIPACDIFWSPHYNIPLLPIRAKKRLTTIHDIFHLAHSETLTVAQRFYARLLTNQAVHRSNRILTVSHFSAQEIIRYTQVDATKIKVVLSGIDKKLFRQINDSHSHQRMESKYGIHGQYILFVGNVKPNKNLRRLVDGFAKLLTELPDLKLVITGKQEGFITGDPALFDRIRADEALASRIIFTGFVDTEDLPVLYSLAHLFAFPSIYEGFGFPPLEAMACGCPVVASNASSIPEICGEAACYVDPLDADDIARGLRAVATDRALRNQLIDAGHRQCLRYDWNESSERFVALIDQLGGE